MTSTRRLGSLFPCVLALVAACAGAVHPQPAGPATPALPSPTGDVHDFDWLAGGWTLDNRRLKARGVGSDEWDEFPAVSCGTILLGGIANIDEIHFPTKGWSGVTVRTFDVARRQWSIYWVNSREGVLFPPVVGGFTGNRGEFYGHDTDEGHPVAVRFIWTLQGPDTMHWEQAFSRDGGHTWETNWENTLHRAPPSVCADGRPVTSS
jgi:hypothetical protein